ncbi:MAG: hypothetical protein ACT4PU_08110 [Planctomycetota bacterium]
MRIPRWTLASLAAFLLLAPVAPASDVVLLNDNLSNGGTAALQLGFVTNETAAAVLAAAPGQYPITLKELQVYVEKHPLLPQASMTVKLYVWSTATISGSSPSLGSAVYASPNLSFTAGGFNIWDVSASNIVLNGPFTVGAQIIATGPAGSPSFVTDSNGCQGGKNWVRQTNGVWANLCSFGVSGDLAIRAKASTATGTGQFIDMANGLAGNFTPTLGGSGSLASGGNFTIAMNGLPPFAASSLVVGYSPLFAPFKGGVMGPSVNTILILGTGAGSMSLPGVMPPGIPANFEIYLQSWTPDVGGPFGFDATNVLLMITP